MKGESGQVSLIAIANHAEYNRASMATFPAAQKRAWDEGAHLLMDQALFWGGCEGKTVVAPRLPDHGFAEDIKKALRIPRLEILVPESPSPFVTRPLKTGWNQVEILRERALQGELRVTAWGMSHGLKALFAALEKSGVRVVTPDLPPPGLINLVHGLDSKTGSRLFLMRHGIPVPEAVAVTSVGAAVAAAGYFLEKGWGAAVKANRGTGGFGVRVYPAAGQAKNPGFMARDLEMRVRMGEYWRSLPLIVERLVESGEGKIISPTTDWRVTGVDGAECLGTGLMRIDRNTFYCGVDAGKGVMDSSLRARCEETGRAVAGILGGMGFRGWFDLDFVVDREGTPYVTELNMRRSSPSHAYDLAEARLGKGWMEKAALRAVDKFAVGDAGEGLSYGQVRPAFQEFNVEMELWGLLAVPHRDALKGAGRASSIGYIILAPDAGQLDRAAIYLEKKILEAARASQWK